MAVRILVNLVLAYFEAIVLNHFTERSQIQTYSLLESRTKENLTQVNWHVLLYSRTKSVTQNIRGFIEILLRATQRVLASRLWLSKQWLRAIVLHLQI